MKLILTTLLLVTVCFANAQNHKASIAKIDNVADAKVYAAKYRDVIVSCVNMEKDRFLFDDIDTSNMHNHVGQTSTLFGRSTKLIKDTMISMVDIQKISFDPNKTSIETIKILINQMKKRIIAGDNYWDLKKKFAHTSAEFWSGPESTEKVESTNNVDLSSSSEGSEHSIMNKKTQIGILILSKAPHDVPAFYTISYNSL